MAAPRSCPCWSELRYSACCAPYHEGKRAPDTPVALMRSRFSAFALGFGTYLVETLAADHEDLLSRDSPEARAALARALASAKHRQRFLGLRILDSREGTADGEVLFRARVFERGVDRSFYELSRFETAVSSTDPHLAAWRYKSGGVLPADPAPREDDLTVERFARLVRLR